MNAVGDGAVVVQGREDLPDRGQNLFDPPHVEEGLLLAGKGRVGQVLCGRARSHREGALVITGQLRVCRADVGVEITGNGWATTAALIPCPTAARRCTSSVSR